MSIIHPKAGLKSSMSRVRRGSDRGRRSRSWLLPLLLAATPLAACREAAPTASIWFVGDAQDCLEFGLKLDEHGGDALHAIAEGDRGADCVAPDDFAASLRRAGERSQLPGLLICANATPVLDLMAGNDYDAGLLRVRGSFDQLGGLVFAHRGASSFEALRASMHARPIDCGAPSPRPLDEEGIELAELLLAAALEGDDATLDRHRSDRALAGAGRWARSEGRRLGFGVPAEVGRVAACRSWAADRFAFVLVEADCNAEDWLGRTRALVVLERAVPGGEWRFVSLTSDPVSIALDFAEFEQSFGRGPSSPVSELKSNPLAPQLLSPDDDALLRRPPPFAQLRWRPALQPGRVLEILEVQVSGEARLFLYPGPPSDGSRSLSLGQMWGDRGSWRAWSLDDHGRLHVSGARRYRIDL